MNKYSEAREALISAWGEQGMKVIRSCEEAQSFNDTFDHFLKHCSAYTFLLSGIRELYPSVYDAIPDEMGILAWDCVCNILTLLGVQPLPENATKN